MKSADSVVHVSSLGRSNTEVEPRAAEPAIDWLETRRPSRRLDVRLQPHPRCVRADAVGVALQLWRADIESTYAQAVRGGLGAVIDRCLAGLIILRLRRHWPLLKLVPESWILPIVAPKASSLRRWLSRGAIAVAVPIGVMTALIVHYT